MEPYVDWYNFMSYDIHGTWDGNNPYTSRVVAPHTNLTEISEGLDLLWRNNIDSSKVVLGIAFYGRSFTLASNSCSRPLCAFSSGGDPGTCTGTSGILSNAEIQRIIQQYQLNPTLDSTAGVKYITWNSNQWVSYDDQETYKMKKDFADHLGLGGLMVWALDLDDPNSSSSLGNLALNGLRSLGDDVDANPQFAAQKLAATMYENNIQLGIFWTDCSPNPVCPDGYRQMQWGLGHGKVFDSDLRAVTADGCHGGGWGYNRALCVEKNVEAYGCGWYGLAKGCKQTCPTGHFLVTQNSHIGGEKAGCDHNRYSSYCCEDFRSTAVSQCPASNAGNALSGGLAPLVANVQALAASNLDYDLERGTTAECAAAASRRLGINGPLLGGSLAGLYILARLPGWWYYSFEEGVYIWRAIRNLAYPSPAANGKCTSVVATGTRTITATGSCPPTISCTSTTTITVETSSPSTTVTKTCDGSRYPQACQNYSSVIRDRKAHSLSVMTCEVDGNTAKRDVPRAWSLQHRRPWLSWVPEFSKLNVPTMRESCQRDEYPPFAFSPNGAWLRYLPAGENGGAGNYWSGLCGRSYVGTTDAATLQGGPASNAVCTEVKSRTYLINAFSMDFKNMPQHADDGMAFNPCLPIITNDADFALLTDDPWYNAPPAHVNPKKTDYANFDIPSSLLVGRGPAPRRQGPYKRTAANGYEFLDQDPDRIFIDDGNSTRKASDDELWEHLGLKRCIANGCESEKRVLGIKSTTARLAPMTITADVITTAAIVPSQSIFAGASFTNTIPHTTAALESGFRRHRHSHRHPIVGT